jgi:hypothetical protein
MYLDAIVFLPFKVAGQVIKNDDSVDIPAYPTKIFNKSAFDSDRVLPK